MKKNKKLVTFSLYAAAFIVAATAIIAGNGVEGSMMVAFALAGIPFGSTATVSGAEESGFSIFREDISDSITKMMPSRTPLDTILRHLKKSQKVESQKIGYYQASYKPIMDVIDKDCTGDGTSAAAPAAKYLYQEGEGMTSIFIKVSNPDIWRCHDTFLMQNAMVQGFYNKPGVNDDGEYFYQDVMFYVTSKSGSVLEVIPFGGAKNSSGKYIVPSFPLSTKIYRMGQAKSELAIGTDPFALYPELNWQYCQNFMAQIEESTFHRLTKKDIAWGFSNFETVNILSMKMEMEMSMLFGYQGEYKQGNDTTFFTRGIIRDIEKEFFYGGASADDHTLTTDQYHSWIKDVFDGNNGSTHRVLFAGSGLIKQLSTVENFDKVVPSNNEASLGINVRKIETYYGTIDIVHSPLFKECGWEECGVILDLEHITKHEFIPMSITDLDLKSSGVKNADAKVIQEVSALTLSYPDCHAVIKPNGFVPIA